MYNQNNDRFLNKEFYNPYGTKVVPTRIINRKRLQDPSYMCRMPDSDINDKTIEIQYHFSQLYNSIEDIPKLPDTELKSNINERLMAVAVEGETSICIYRRPREAGQGEKGIHKDVTRRNLLSGIKFRSLDRFNDCHSDYKVYIAPLIFE